MRVFGGLAARRRTTWSPVPGIDFADRTGSPLHVVHAWDVPVGYGWDDETGKYQRLSRLEKDARLTISETIAGTREVYLNVNIAGGASAVREEPVTPRT